MELTGILAVLLVFVVDANGRSNGTCSTLCHCKAKDRGDTCCGAGKTKMMLCMPVDQELQLSLLTLFDHSVLVVWKGPKLEDIKDCDVMHHAINSTILEETVEQMMPLDYTMEVDDLQPLTAYQLQVVCHTKHNVKFSSKHFNFTTAGEGCTVRPAISHPVSVPGTQSSLASTKLPVLQKKMSTSTSSLDLVLGVLFACLGVSVMLTLAYFLLKKYRRHQRIRRFLQYRQQENDTFTDLGQEEDEGIGM